MAKLSLAKLERHLYSAADRLRQEGLDAATYKDYIFGLLFLKRCSDVFEADRERIVGRKVEQGMFKEVAETQYGENPDFYDGFFIPERARWDYLRSRLGDAMEPYGSVLDKALGALSQANESLEHVLDHISFMRVQSNKRIVSDDACKDLVRHFSRYRLRNEDFQFSDLLGAAYEFLINMFAESAGKKGGDFYTPRDVIRLMVRIIKPRPGLSIYDPTCGSGGMLIISREFVEQSGGDATNLRLCGQVNDASAWSICKLNMLLHGNTRWLEGAIKPPEAPRPVMVVGGITGEAEEEALVSLNDWVEAQGLPRGQMSFDYTDPNTGEQGAVFDLAWPNGVQEGLSQPVAVLLNEGEEILALASSAGFRCFTNIEGFKAYVMKEVLREALTA